MLKKVHPVIYTTQLGETVDFYTGTLGFTTDFDAEKDTWAFLERDKTGIMVSLPNSHVHFEKPVFTGSFYFITDKIDQLWEEFNNKANVCYPIETFDYGMREFAIFDNNGYILQFGEEV